VGKVPRENPVLALYWPCKGLQCSLSTALRNDFGEKHHDFQILQKKLKSADHTKGLIFNYVATYHFQCLFVKILTND
jgi:hypothetical protein